MLCLLDVNLEGLSLGSSQLLFLKSEEKLTEHVLSKKVCDKKSLKSL
jgi:hypothetical protein